LTNDVRFDVIFIDGLHLAEQVDRDIKNSLEYLKEDGFLVLHDCNPPTEWHAREDYYYEDTPAGGYWNGTTWKAFQKWRYNDSVTSCCIDTDWGVGVISKKHHIGKAVESKNEFYEYNVLNKDRAALLNLTAFGDFKAMVSASFRTS